MRTPSPERWREVERVLDAALDLATAERAAFLDRSCGDDAELRAEIERLLRAHAEAAEFLEEPPPSVRAVMPAAGASGLTATLALPGAVVAGRYVLERELGRGGMATVYLAQDGKHRRPVALKILNHDLAHAVSAARFLREITITANLQHPHILPLHDSGEFEGLVYYVMPYVAGESLRDRLSREQRLPIAEAVRLARDVAGALDYAHRRGVVHRDIKPANILLEDGQAIVADFGIARAVSGAAGGGGVDRGLSTPVTRPGAMIGTPAYMSPEQLSGDDELSGPSDVYSLGCVVYEMLAGQPPFTGTASGAIIAKHLRQPPPLRALRPEVPVSIERAIARALSMAPAERFQSAGEFMEALIGGDGLLAPPPLAARLPRVRTRSLAMIGVVLVALAAAATLVTRRERPPIVAPAAAIAVFPFVPAVADTALTRLGRELVITLSSSLEGVGGIRTVDALTVLANVRATDAPATLADAVGLARRVGASSVVYGSVMRAGDIVRIDLSLHPTSGPAPLARASVTGLQYDIAALTDSAAWGLLREVWQKTDPPTPSLAAITTRSLPALRAFLHGERLIVDGQWRAAADAFQGAFAADSTFWLAYWRYALAQDFNALPVDPAIRAKYRAHRKEFPERDRLLIEAGLSDSLSEHFELVKAITVRFPDYWPGWWALSEHLAHTGPLLGTSDSDLRVALERTVALNPRMVSAWDHLFWVAMWQRDTVLSGRVLRELTTLRYDFTSRQETGSDALAFTRYIDALARGGGVTRDTAFTEPLFRMRESLVGTIDPNAFALGASFYGFPRGQVELTRALTARGEPTGLATASRLALVIALAERGAWDSALVAMDQLVAGTSDPMWPLYRYRLAVIGAWLGAVDPMIAAGQRAAAARVGAHLQPESRAELAWLDGLFAVARNDAGALAAARRSVEGTDSITAPFLGRSLRAFSIALAGDRARAADSLVKLERERAEFGWSRWRSDPHPFLTAVNRLAAASWLVERGDGGAAAPLLTWHQAVLFPMGHTAHANVIVQPHAYLEQARVAEALGQYDLARTYYQRFLWLYDAPVEAHRHLVRRAHEAVARLARQ